MTLLWPVDGSGQGYLFAHKLYVNECHHSWGWLSGTMKLKMVKSLALWSNWNCISPPVDHFCLSIDAIKWMKLLVEQRQRPQQMDIWFKWHSTVHTGPHWSTQCPNQLNVYVIAICVIWIDIKNRLVGRCTSRWAKKRADLFSLTQSVHVEYLGVGQHGFFTVFNEFYGNNCEAWNWIEVVSVFSAPRKITKWPLDW